MRAPIVSSLLALLATFAYSATLDAQSAAPNAIAQFGGDAQHTGRSPFRGPHAQPSVRWRVRARHRVFASPIVTNDDGCVFAGVDGAVHLLDRNGVERWARLDDHDLFATPAAWGDLVLVGRVGGSVAALGARGEARWRVDAHDDVDAPIAVQGDFALVAAHGALALDRAGHTRWTVAMPGHVFGAPAISRDGASAYIADLLGNLFVVHTADGSVVRRIATGSPAYGGVLVLDDGTAVLGGRDGHVRSYDANGALRWDFTTRDEIHATPALGRDGTIVIGSDDGGIYGLHASDGTQAFRVATSGRVRSSARIDADGYVFVGSEDDMLYALDPHGAVAWRYSIGADVDSSVAIASDGTLFVGSDDAGLYALR